MYLVLIVFIISVVLILALVLNFKKIVRWIKKI